MKGFGRILLIALLFIASAALANNDPGGWKGAKWGMTATEIKKVMPNLTDGRTVGGEDILHLDSVNIDEYIFDASLFFDKNGKLSTANLMSSVEGEKEKQFQKIKQLLSEKYGEPKFANRHQPFRGTFEDISSWMLPTTKIELRYSAIYSVDYHVITVIYSMNTDSGL